MTTLEIVETIEFDELVISQQVTSVEVYSNVSLGPTGPQGYLVDSWRGPWDGNITSENPIYREYERGDIVSHNGALWVALVDSNAEFDYPGNSDKWEKLIERSILLESWESAWEPYAYSRGSVVSYDGSIWIAVSDVQDTDIPGATIGTWDLMVSKGDTGNIAYWFQGDWTPTAFSKGKAVTHDGSLWVAHRDTVATEIPGGPAVVQIAGQMPQTSSSSWLPAKVRWQEFQVTSEILVTHVRLQTSVNNALCELRDSLGNILATYIPAGHTVDVPLSAPVLLTPGNSYYLSTNTSSWNVSTPLPAATGVLSVTNSQRVGTWPGVLENGRYLPLSISHTPDNPWVQLAAKGDDFADAADVTFYGAKGDGVTDDRAAIMAALAAAQAGGKVVKFPSGIYLISAPIDGTWHGISLKGSGGEWQTRIKAAGNFPVVTGVWHWCEWSDISLDANGLGGAGAIAHLDRTLFKRIHVLGWTGYGLKLNDGTLEDSLGLLNRIYDCDIEQSTGVAIHTGYRFTDSWIENCNIGSTSENINLEGGPIRILKCHLNGEPTKNIVLRGNRRVLIANNILEGARREGIRWEQPPWETFDTDQQIQIVGNTFSNGSKEAEGGYSAISLNGLTESQRGMGFQVVGNVFACEDPGSGWKYVVDGVNVKYVSASGNMWYSGHINAAPVRLVASANYEVIGNHGDNAVVTS